MQGSDAKLGGVCTKILLTKYYYQKTKYDTCISISISPPVAGPAPGPPLPAAPPLGSARGALARPPLAAAAPAAALSPLSVHVPVAVPVARHRPAAAPGATPPPPDGGTPGAGPPVLVSRASLVTIVLAGPLDGYSSAIMHPPVLVVKSVSGFVSSVETATRNILLLL